MRHILGLNVAGLFGLGASVVLMAGVCLGVEPRKPSPPPPAPVQSPAYGGGLRNVNPASSGGLYTDQMRRAAAARAAARSAAANPAPSPAATAAANAQRTSITNSNNTQSSASYSQSYPYGYGYGNYYSPYGYSPYGYYRPRANSYLLGYNPYTGTAFLYPSYAGGYYSGYGNSFGYYSNPSLGYGYPGMVFADASQLYGLGPIQQLMGVSGWFQ